MSEAREAAIRLLRQIDFDQATLEAQADELRPTLVEVARGDAADADQAMRRTAIALLGAVGDDSAVDTLVALVTDERPDYRANAIRSLGTIDARRAAPILQQRLRDDELPVAEGRIIVAALARIGDADSVRAVKAFRKSFRNARRSSPGLARDLERIDEAIRRLEARR